jgi:hypothetical protein
VIFALSGKEKLPEKVKEWIEMWLWLIESGHPALVPLFESANAESAAIGRYLRSVTASKHLDCFPTRRNLRGAVTGATLPAHATVVGRASRRRIDRGQRFAVAHSRLNE